MGMQFTAEQIIDHITENPIVDLTKTTLHSINSAYLRPEGNASWPYMEAFRRLAEIGADYVIRERRSQDIMVYSILYNYRHYIELACKRIIGMYHSYRDLDPPNILGHKLSILWPRVREIIIEIHGCSGDLLLDRVDQIIEQLQTWDDNGTAFRYSEDTKGNNSLPGVRFIGIDTVKLEMDNVDTVLDFTSVTLTEALKNEGKYWQ